MFKIKDFFMIVIWGNIFDATIRLNFKYLRRVALSMSWFQLSVLQLHLYNHFLHISFAGESYDSCTLSMLWVSHPCKSFDVMRKDSAAVTYKSVFTVIHKFNVIFMVEKISKNRSREMLAMTCYIISFS